MDSNDVQKAHLFDLVNLDNDHPNNGVIASSENRPEGVKLPPKKTSTSKKIATVRPVLITPYKAKTTWRRLFTLKLAIVLTSLLLIGFTLAVVLLKIYERNIVAELSLPAESKHEGQDGKGDWAMTDISSDWESSDVESSGWESSDNVNTDKGTNITTDIAMEGVDLRGRDESIRLVGGNNIYEGRVELRRNGVWGTICHRQWSKSDGHVACRQLGFGQARYVLKWARFGEGSGQIWLKNLRCDGSEEWLGECNRPYGWGSVRGCTHVHDASVRCEQGGPPSSCASNPCDNGATCTNDGDDYRCTCRAGYVGARCNIDRDDCQNNPCQNGGVCTDRLDDYQCACPSGYRGKNCQQEPTDPCDAVTCQHGGTCTSNSNGFVCNCEAGYTGVFCQTIIDTSQPDVTVRLVGGTDYAGIVQVWRDGIWGTICDDYWDIREATVVCRQLGFSSAVAAYNWNDQYQSTFPHVNGQIWLDNLQCYGFESDIGKCQHEGWGNNNCVHDYDFSEQAGVMCSDPSIVPSNDLLNTGICGTRPVVDGARIVGGVNADVGEWPWIASLRDSNGYHRCGAVLISPQWAITAAHCSSVARSVVLGDIRVDIASATHHESIVELFIHPQYNSQNIDNDITLLKLSNPVTEDQFAGGYIRPVCLAVSSSETTLYSDSTCKAVGWGDSEFEDTDAPPRHLQEVDIPLITKSKCLEEYGHITDNMICTDSPRYAGTCQGDSGGPLQCSLNGVWHLVGATSHGRNCGLIGIPDVFARVSRYTQFIKQTVDMNGGP